MKPNFLVIGAPRSGTTALYEGLAQHPEIYMSPRKEPWFAGFTGDPGPWRGPRDAQPVRTWVEYEELFAGARDERAVGEASTLYLAMPKSPTLIRESLPDARLVAILRDPVERAYSNFLEHVQEGRETEFDFLRAVELEGERRQKGWAPSWSYTGLGYYGEQLDRYLAVFPREQLLVLLQEDLRADRAQLYRRIFAFLGVDPSFTPTLPPRTNENSGLPKSRLLHYLLTRPNPLRQAMRRMLSDERRSAVHSWLLHYTLRRPRLQPGARRELIGRFREDILHTQQLLGRDLSAWLTVRD